MTTYKKLREANEARQREWDSGNAISLMYRCNELAGEVGEVCNIIKKLERERLGIVGSRATVDELADELADVVICCDLLAMDGGFTLDWLGKSAVSARFKLNCGVRLAASCGRVCMVVEKLDAGYGVTKEMKMSIGSLWLAAGSLWLAVRITAGTFGVDLDAAVIRKFNATSEKNGLLTRLAP